MSFCRKEVEAMSRTVRRRFWLETGTAAIGATLGAVTLFWRDWVEALTGWDPDRHSGWLEWAVVAALLGIAVAVGAAARAEWRRPEPSLAVADA
jgi:hypothetical protein